MEPIKPDDLRRIDKKLDDLFVQLSQLTIEVKELAERSGLTSKMMESHQRILHGNGKDGLVAIVARGRVDTLTVKSVCALVGAIGALIATVIGAGLVPK